MRTDLDSSSEAMTPARPRTRHYGLVGLLLVIALAALFIAGYLPRRNRMAALAAEARVDAASRRIVHVVAVRRSSATTDTTLPGNIQAMDETPIYARADGYIRRRIADIGDRVNAGALLAEIEMPELDQQIRQARAAIQQSQAAALRARATQAQAEANLKLAEVSLKRWQPLVSKGVLPQQEGDQKQADFDAQQANVRAAAATVAAADSDVQASEANLQRLVELKGFSRVTAPFAGVITARNVDTGTLISAGASTTTRQLFNLAQIDRLRIYINVPQAFASAVRVGQSADVSVQERQGRVFKGSVTRTANSLDERTRTLLTEVQVANGSRQLLPGMYAQVKLVLSRVAPPLLIPADTLLVRADGNYVVVVPENGAIRYRKVSLGRDYGRDVEINAGLSGDERLIENPTDDLKDGDVVSVGTR